MNNNSNFRSNTPGRMRDIFSRSHQTPKSPIPPLHPVQGIGASQAANSGNELAKQAAAPARARLAPPPAIVPDNTQTAEAPMPFDRMRRALRGWKSPEPAPPAPTFRKLVQRLQSEARDYAQSAQNDPPTNPAAGMIRFASRNNSPAENIVSDASVATDSLQGDATTSFQRKSSMEKIPIHTPEEIGNRFIKEKGIDYSGITDIRLKDATGKALIRLSNSPLGRELIDYSLKNGWDGRIMDAVEDRKACGFVQSDVTPTNQRPIEYPTIAFAPNLCINQNDPPEISIGRTLVHELFHYGYDRLFTPWSFGQFNIPTTEAYDLASDWQEKSAYKYLEKNDKLVPERSAAGEKEFIDKYFLRYHVKKP